MRARPIKGATILCSAMVENFALTMGGATDMIPDRKCYGCYVVDTSLSFCEEEA